MRAARLAAMIGSAVLCAGCRVGPVYHPPAPPTTSAPNYKESPANFPDGGAWRTADPHDAMLKGNWWEVFGDTELNALEARLQIDNQNIKQYFENFMAARALIAEARSAYWPTVTLNPSAIFSRGSGSVSGGSGATTGAAGATGTTGAAGGGTGSTADGSVSSGEHALYALPLDASWAPDLWGKIHNEVLAAENGAQVSAADLENERLTEQAALAEYFFELRGQDEVGAVLQRTAAADRESLQIAQSRYNTGVDTELAVVEAQIALDTVNTQLAGLGVERAQYEHAIAMLTGAVATGFSLPVRAAVYTPPAIPTGLPSQLLERRPDVAAAERTVAEANAAIGVGYAAFFPQLTLSGELGLESSALKKLISLPSRYWSLGPSFSQTLFNGGLYRAELQQYQAMYDADVASYREVVLTAFEQVEDALAAVRIYSDEIVKQTAAVQDAQKFLDLETARYRTGVDPYLDVLTAQTTLLSNQEQLATLQSERMTSAVQLVQALGGGWDASQLPSPDAVGRSTGGGGLR